MAKLTGKRADSGNWTLKEMVGSLDSCAGIVPNTAEEIWEKN